MRTRIPRLLAIVGVAAAGVLGVARLASGHTSTLDAKCVNGQPVGVLDPSGYQPALTNHYGYRIDAGAWVTGSFHDGAELHLRAIPLGSPTVGHTFDAYIDGADGYDRNWDDTIDPATGKPKGFVPGRYLVGACQAPVTTSTATTGAPASTTTTTTTTTAPATTIAVTTTPTITTTSSSSTPAATTTTSTTRPASTVTPPTISTEPVASSTAAPASTSPADTTSSSVTASTVAVSFPPSSTTADRTPTATTQPDGQLIVLNPPVSFTGGPPPTTTPLPDVLPATGVELFILGVAASLLILTGFGFLRIVRRPR